MMLKDHNTVTKLGLPLCVLQKRQTNMLRFGVLVSQAQIQFKDVQYELYDSAPRPADTAFLSLSRFWRIWRKTPHKSSKLVIVHEVIVADKLF